MGWAVSEDQTTAVVQRYLDELAGDSPAEPIVRALLDRAVRRLHLLGATLLHRIYPRLARPPWNVQADELLGAVEERLLKALREAPPRTVRQRAGQPAGSDAGSWVGRSWGCSEARR
jgi:RNA polymerase sigma-70 factor (ECF subfamily)